MHTQPHRLTCGSVCSGPTPGSLLFYMETQAGEKFHQDPNSELTSELLVFSLSRWPYFE